MVFVRWSEEITAARRSMSRVSVIATAALMRPHGNQKQAATLNAVCLPKEAMNRLATNGPSPLPRSFVRLKIEKETPLPDALVEF